MGDLPGRAHQRVPRPPGARPGGPPPWAGRRGPVGLARVRTAMASLGPTRPDADLSLQGRPAAVLVALFEEDGDTRVVLTRRSSRLRSHTGEVSFPGGRLDDGEEPVAAALREASEEVGLDPASVEILGQLAPVTTASSTVIVTPFVGALTRRPALRPNPHEVEHAFDVGLADLLEDGVYREERWDTPAGADRPVHFFHLADDVVWGATARVLHQLLGLAVAAP